MELRNSCSKIRRHTLVVLCFAFILISYSFVPALGDKLQAEDAGVLIKEGRAFKRDGEFLESISRFQRVYELAVKNENLDLQLESLKQLGILRWNLGKIEDSLQYYKAALEIADELNLEHDYSFCSTVLNLTGCYLQGREYNRQKEFLKSVDSFKNAINLSRQVESREHELKCLRQLSITYWDMSDLDKFYVLNEEGLKIARDINHKVEIGRALNNIGLYYWKQNKYSKALSLYYESLDISRWTGNLIGESACLNNIGIIYKNLDYYDKALEYIQKAIIIDKNIGNDLDVAIDLNNVGTIYRRKAEVYGNKEHYLKSLFIFMDCLDIVRKINDKNTEIAVLNNIGNVYQNLGMFKKSKLYFKQGLEMIKSSKELESIGMLFANIGFVHFSENALNDAQRAFQQAIDYGLKSGANNLLWEAYFGLGKVYEQNGMPFKAIECYEQSIEQIEHVKSMIALDTQKASYFRNKYMVYDNLMGLYYKNLQKERSSRTAAVMFNFSERAKARAFLDILGESELNIRENMNVDLREKEKFIKEKISNHLKFLATGNYSKDEKDIIINELLEAEDNYITLMAQMRIENPEFTNMVSPLPNRLEDIQRHLLTKKEVLIKYHLGEQRSYVFAVTMDNILLATLAPQDQIHESVKAYLKAISDPPRNRFKAKSVAKRLYTELLGPVMKIVNGSVSHFVIVPDGALNYLPFETLISDLSYSNYLISEYSVSYMPSASSLLYLKNNDTESYLKKDLLAFGNPANINQPSPNNPNNQSPSDILLELYEALDFDFSPIPFSSKEVKNIAKYFPYSKRDIYLNFDASEDIVKSLPLEDYRIIHFACHGFLDEVFPFRSALVLSLSNDSKEDGFLQVREIYNLRMKAELVVLSACQTGRGRLEYGEGVLGLPRIFFYAGARSVLSTLWSIGDKPTAKFMEFFYEHLSQGYSKAEALRLAKLNMIKSKYSHPFYWAAFVLNGDYANSIF